MVLNGSSVLLFVPTASQVLVEIERTYYPSFCPLILRLELSPSAIKNKVYYDLATTLYYFQIRRGSELTGQKS